MRRGDGQVSAPLVPDLFALCKVLTAAIIWVVQQIIYALAGPIPPLAGLGDFLGTDFVITLITWLIVVTVVVLWVTVINLFTIMWVERKLYPPPGPLRHHDLRVVPPVLALQPHAEADPPG